MITADPIDEARAALESIRRELAEWHREVERLDKHIPHVRTLVQAELDAELFRLISPSTRQNGCLKSSARIALRICHDHSKRYPTGCSITSEALTEVGLHRGGEGAIQRIWFEFKGSAIPPPAAKPCSALWAGSSFCRRQSAPLS